MLAFGPLQPFLVPSDPYCAFFGHKTQFNAAIYWCYIYHLVIIVGHSCAMDTIAWHLYSKKHLLFYQFQGSQNMTR